MHHWESWPPFFLLVPRDVPWVAEGLKTPGPMNKTGRALFHKWIMQVTKLAKAYGAVGRALYYLLCRTAGITQ